MYARSEARNLAIALIGPLVFIALYYLRSFDDNTLTSWQWVFAHVEAGAVFTLVCFSSALAYAVSDKGLPPAHWTAALGFVISAILWSEPEVIVDASRYFTQAKHLSEYGIGYFLSEWGRGIEPWTDMPLMPALWGLSFSLFGESRVIAQLLTSGMFALSIWLTSKAGEELFYESDYARELGALGAVMMLGMPFLLSQSALMLVDVPGMCLLMLAVFAYQRAIMRGGALWAGLAALAVLMLTLAKYSLWLMAFVLLMVGAVHAGRSMRTVIIRSAWVLALWAIGFGAFIYAYSDIVSAQMKLLTEYQKPGLSRWGESHISTFFFQVHPFVSLAAIASAAVAWKRRDTRYLALLFLPLLLLAMGVRRARYLIPMLPMLGLMAAYALSAIKEQRTRRLLAYLAASASIIIALAAYLPYLRTNNLVNLMHAGAYLDTLDGDTVEVVTLPQQSSINPAVAVPLLDLYTHKRLVYTGQPEPSITHEEILGSPFRFTWAYRNPDYYAADNRPDLLAVVSPDEPAVIQGYGLLQRFDASEGVFTFKPFVNIYSPDKYCPIEDR